MENEVLIWTGFGLSLFAAFLYSLFHIGLSSSSKISLSRILEDREKQARSKILDIYDELKVSTEILRIIFLIAFLAFLFMTVPQWRIWSLWFFLGLVLFYILILEMIPRLLNSRFNPRILLFFLTSFRLPYILTKPILWVLKPRGDEEEPEEQREASEEELDAFVVEAAEEGIIEEEEGELLKSVVEFGDTIVREIMTPRVAMICISKNADIDQLRRLVIKEKHSRIPVYQDRIDSIEGIILAKDLLEYSADKFRSDSLESLIREVYFIPESMRVTELLKEFQKRKQKLAVVVDEHGGVSGVVTMEDLMEEIVGEIQDEYDKDEIQIIQEGPSDYIVLGDVDVEELEDLFDLDLAEDDYITVGGLITHTIGRLPEMGEKVVIKGLTLEVLDVDQKRIKKLKIKKTSS